MNFKQTTAVLLTSLLLAACSSTSSNQGPGFDDDKPRPELEKPPINELPPEFDGDNGWGNSELPHIKPRPDLDRPPVNELPPEFDGDSGWGNSEHPTNKPKPDVNPFELVIDEENGQAKIYRKEDGKTIAIIEPNGDGTYTVRDGAMSWDNTYVIYQNDLGQIRIDWERSEIDAGWGAQDKAPKVESLSQAQRNTLKSRVNNVRMKVQQQKR
ncbi:hypothetical protein L2719_02020 [Shewanella schlegeliana]|uniref:Lipoprotein n=1 Tax=Shewanella schlegeliana TaxID=190308 RepID=A0ABS1SY35_9GAMM|nr:hypothetical protein [Shewanella schlegeliana]MBL4913453.1 hypothetical protein [Shewanella schlegeliana]MCL1108343.1 hypothetical protein [Shewanella schlegeliana]GIU34350.1 hypothetical protein TUM4433_30320 [Shewanella schlegeliana]